ncbi:hypothetical protein FHX15_004563 [Rhizobium sp. BK650]|nr:hypothetical protein [Rhizobium sp. BK650]
MISCVGAEQLDACKQLHVRSIAERHSVSIKTFHYECFGPAGELLAA